MSQAAYSDLFSPGNVLMGRYQVERVLGEGGMGVVVAARHLELDTLVAVKLLRPEALANPEIVARFAREARAAAKIKSEHVARVTDVGTLPVGAPYMVMEYLEGSDLAACVRSAGPMPVERAVDFVLQACEAIAEAHSLGIVHRDLKPANLFLSKRPDGSELVKVLDFGISKMTEASGTPQPSMTGTSAMLGSPTYMSPEQLASSRRVDARSDVWALGIILYELLSARLPFLAETIPLLYVAILQTAPSPLSSFRADLPRGLEAVVARCMEKNAAARFANVGELATALLAFAPARSRVSVDRILRLTQSKADAASISGVTVAKSANDEPPRAATLAVPGFETQNGWGQTASKSKSAVRRNLVFAAAAAVGVVVVGASVLVASRRSGETDFGAPTQKAVLAAPGPASPSSALPSSESVARESTPKALPTDLPAPLVAAAPVAVPPSSPAGSSSAAPRLPEGSSSAAPRLPEGSPPKPASNAAAPKPGPAPRPLAPPAPRPSARPANGAPPEGSPAPAAPRGNDWEVDRN